ncbi:MAG: hypothetical protein QM489_04585, partial [Candidatus Izemoplasma sp.]
EVVVFDSNKNYIETLIDPSDRDIYNSYQSGFKLSISEVTYTKSNQYLIIYSIEEPVTAVMFLGRDTYKMGFVVLVAFAVAPVKFRMPFKVRVKKE